MLSERLWNSIGEIYDGILSSPFIKELTDGTLEFEKFKFYITQDYLYLKEYGKVLLKAGIASGNSGNMLMFMDHVKNSLSVEKQLHTYYIGKWNIDESVVEMSPTNRAYTNFLHVVADSEPFPNIVAAVLPCYWIYLRVGKELSKRGSPNEDYGRWIRAYGLDPNYERAVVNVINLLDSFELTDEQIKQVEFNFKVASTYEFMFWDSAYRLERFPFKFR